MTPPRLSRVPKGSRLGVITLAALMPHFFSTSAHAQLFLGWADEFLTGLAHCNTQNNGCFTASYWGGANWINSNVIDNSAAPTWSHVGMQGSDPAGRANARSKVMTGLYEADASTERTMTVTISRYRVPPRYIGGEGQACGSVAATFVGSSSYNVNTLGSPAYLRFEKRLLPVMNFSAETAVNTTIGYIETVTVSTGGSMGPSSTKYGCFKLRWL
jgi:hypothetical protein